MRTALIRTACFLVSLRSCQLLAVAALVFGLASGRANAENWPQWRGPNNDGVSGEKGLPVEWSAEKNVLWRLPLPGPGGATPVVWGDRVFVTSSKENELVLVCASTDGKIVWEKSLGGGNKLSMGDEGNSASPSPSTDGKHVWAMVGTGILACFDFEGNEAWRVDLQERYGKFAIQWGMSSSPLLVGDRLYLQIMHQQAALVVALDKSTGAEVWKHQRISDAEGENLDSYASPVLYRDEKHEFLLTHGADYVIAHRLDNGDEIWRCGGFNPAENYNRTLRLVASPLAAPGLIVVPSAKQRSVMALTPDNKGDITTSSERRLWLLKDNTPDVSSPLAVDGLVYLCRENGILRCVDAKTGQEYYSERCYSDRYRASPVYADGHVYVSSRKGVTTVVKAGRKFEPVAENDIGEALSSSPAISGGRIYLRTFDALYAIGK